MEHFPFPRGEAPLGLPVHQRLHNPGHLIEVPAFQAQHILLVTLVPVGVGLHGQSGNGVQQCLSLFGRDDRTDTDGAAVGHRNLQHKTAHRHLEDIVFLCDPSDFFLDDIVDNAGAVHRMHDQIPNAEHGKSFSFPVRAVTGSRSVGLFFP